MYPVVAASNALSSPPLSRVRVGCGRRISDIAQTSLSKIPPLNPRLENQVIERSSGSRLRHDFRSKLKKPSLYPLIPRLAPNKDFQTDSSDSRALCEATYTKPFEPAWCPPPTTNIPTFPALTFSPEPHPIPSFSESWQIPSQRTEMPPPIIETPAEIKQPATEDCLCKKIKKHLSQAWAGFTWLVKKSLYIPKTILFALAENPSDRKPRRRYE